MNTAIPAHRACVFCVLVAAALVLAGATARAQTMKERLSDKASDQQRIDNCRVAPERRGPVPRPDCPAQTPAVAETTKPR
jgi:hypothetical protein